MWSSVSTRKANCIKIPKKFKSKSDLGQERTRKRNLLRLKPASRMEIHCLCRILIIRDYSAFERQELEDHELDFPTFLTMIFTLWIFYDNACFFQFFPDGVFFFLIWIFVSVLTLISWDEHRICLYTACW